MFDSLVGFLMQSHLLLSFSSYVSVLAFTLVLKYLLNARVFNNDTLPSAGKLIVSPVCKSSGSCWAHGPPFLLCLLSQALAFNLTCGLLSFQPQTRLYTFCVASSSLVSCLANAIHLTVLKIWCSLSSSETSELRWRFPFLHNGPESAPVRRRVILRALPHSFLFSQESQFCTACCSISQEFCFLFSPVFIFRFTYFCPVVLGKRVSLVPWTFYSYFLLFNSLSVLYLTNNYIWNLFCYCVRWKCNFIFQPLWNAVSTCFWLCIYCCREYPCVEDFSISFFKKKFPELLYIKKYLVIYCLLSCKEFLSLHSRL